MSQRNIFESDSLSKDDRIIRDNNVSVVDVPLSKVVDNPYQPRKKYSGIVSLAKNISKRGLQSPVNVVERDGSYILISGHRRTRAFRKLHRKSIPAIIRKQNSEYDLILDLAIENSLRNDLTPFEKAKSYLDVFGLISSTLNDPEKVCSLVGQVKLLKRRGSDKVKNDRGNCSSFSFKDIMDCKKLLELLDVSENHVVTHLRLFKLPESISEKVIHIENNRKQLREEIKDGFISTKLGYELSRVSNPDIQNELYNHVVENELNAASTSAIVDQMLEEGIIDDSCSLGTSKKRSSNDYGLGSFVKSINLIASRIWSFRAKYQKIEHVFGKVLFRAALRNLKKSAEMLIDAMDPYFDDEDIWRIDKVSEYSFDIQIKPGKSKTEFRFSFPAKDAKRLGVRVNDILKLKVCSIKRIREVSQ